MPTTGGPIVGWSLRRCKSVIDSGIVVESWEMQDQGAFHFGRLVQGPLVPDSVVASECYQMPPRATVIASPLIPPAASAQRNRMTRATSIGSNTLLRG